MAEIISLSSDEEYDPPPKRIKPSPVLKDMEIIELSDNEDDPDKNTVNTPSESLKENNLFGAIVEINEDSQENKENHKKDNSMDLLEDSNIKNNGKENSNEPEDTENMNEVTSDSQPSTSSSLINHKGLNDFLNLCEEKTKGSHYKLTFKFPMAKKLFNKCGTDHAESENFQIQLRNWMTMASDGAVRATLAFSQFYNYLKGTRDSGFEVDSEEQVIKLRKLEKAIVLLKRKIKQLEAQEIDFDDEEDSSFIQLDRYIKRLDKVYKKYCQILKKNPHSGRKTYEKIGFVHSDVLEINQAINSKYKNSLKFPTYIEVENVIRKCVSDNDLPLNENKIISESKQVFEKLGKLLQNQRRKELYECHSLYIENAEDPSKQNADLDKQLRINNKLGKEKIENICEMFVKKQDEKKIEVQEESEDDSDNSHYQDSEDEQCV